MQRKSFIDRSVEQGCLVDWAVAPFTEHEADSVKEQLHKLAAQRTLKVSTADVEVLVQDGFHAIHEAARIFSALLDVREIPTGERLDWRPRIRRLLHHPRGVKKLLKDDIYRPLLYEGFLMVEDQAAKDWEDLLSESEDLTCRVAQSILANPYTKGSGRRPKNWPLVEYIKVIASVYEKVSERELGRGVSYSATNPEISGEPRGPALYLIGICLEPFQPDITNEAIANRIREIQALAST